MILNCQGCLNFFPDSFTNKLPIRYLIFVCLFVCFVLFGGLGWGVQKMYVFRTLDWALDSTLLLSSEQQWRRLAFYVEQDWVALVSQPC